MEAGGIKRMERPKADISEVPQLDKCATKSISSGDGTSRDFFRVCTWALSVSLQVYKMMDGGT